MLSKCSQTTEQEKLGSKMKNSKADGCEQLCSLTMMSNEASLEGKFERLRRVLLYNLNNSAIFFNYSDQLLYAEKKFFRNFFFLLLTVKYSIKDFYVEQL